MAGLSFDGVVVGAGIVGLACARELLRSGRCSTVLCIDRFSSIVQSTSSRNSEVIHAGIYYEKDSHKAKLCVEGKKLLYEYCENKGIPHRRIGKLIVSPRNQDSSISENALRNLQAKAESNGVHDLRMLSPDEVSKLEPNVSCGGALLSPSTGILDSHSLADSLRNEFESAGGTLALYATLKRVRVCDKGLKHLLIADRHESLDVSCKIFVNAGGLSSWDVAKMFVPAMSMSTIPPKYFAKGNYFSFSGESPCSRLIYPLPESGGLGIHLTLDLAGNAKFGPDVEWLTLEGQEEIDSSVYAVNEERQEHFVEKIASYLPLIYDNKNRLLASYSGIRAKVSGPGSPSSDFIFLDKNSHGLDGTVHMFGIESPGLTSSLAIGRYVTKILE